MPKGDTLYDYLEKSSILKNGTPEEIREVKKEYWKMRRKEWRKQQRAACKSCTIFFNRSEYKIVTNAFVGKMSVAGFVKQAALNAAQNKTSINKELVGQIREAFFAGYSTMEKMTKDVNITTALLDLERKVLNLIK